MQTMTPVQKEFFAALQAPIPNEDLKHRTQGGTRLTYITSRTLYNRLDEVAGPTNWYTEYERTDRGVVCKLWINVPADADADDVYAGRRWMYKSDGGGFAGMSDKDNDEKSGFSDGAKRAGAVWGIARELYGNGMPDYIEEATPAQAPAAAPSRGNQGGQPARNQAPAQNQAPSRSGPPQRGGPPHRGGDSNSGGGKQYDNFAPPTRPGGATFAWAKKQEETFGDGIVKEMDVIVAEFGYPKNFKDLDAEQQMYVCWAAIDAIKTWETYGGQYDHLADPRPPQNPQ